MDQVVEAVENREVPWQVGVQWHPEYLRHEEPAQRRFFEDLVEDGRRFRQGTLGRAPAPPVTPPPTVLAML